MPLRLRKLVGTLILVVLVVSYAIVATLFAAVWLTRSPWWAHLLYFLFSGFLWVVPAMVVIGWMERPAGRTGAN